MTPSPQQPSHQTGAPALEVESLSIGFNGQTVVSDISFSVARAQTLALVGESGCGKSVTALSLMNLLPHGASATATSMKLAGDELTGYRERDWHAIRGSRIGMIFQDPGSALDPLMTVGRQIAEALRLRGITEPAALRTVACEMLSRVGISDPQQRLDQYPFELSGGMCQRVMIVIAMAAEAELLIADEPTTALDVTIQAQILALIETLQRETGTSVL
ncbi:MAG: ATP-binding cassette domain-containing protein, partial [Granulosicoccus sp.]